MVLAVSWDALILQKASLDLDHMMVLKFEEQQETIPHCTSAPACFRYSSVPLVKTSHVAKASLKEEGGYRLCLLVGGKKLRPFLPSSTEPQWGKHNGTQETF